ncbi:hypothetical protein G6O67_003178 [Ophiocordyceps sinensis]|uniref:TMEM205-like domain-containing protein n=2 Tax=Ophiocordyceps sinensis TaxID=72228 RepID=A0A8H4PVT7_9HYPO|nr:hypothetical protein OCS_01571 [Ophiocordyceps sinensis CO18]KAF4511372.1 hypothetical protein G6O67_003178 [Ophiocordyceps sinensis]
MTAPPASDQLRNQPLGTHMNKMADSSILFSVAPYHIISYGTLLGTTFFHSFVNGSVLYKTIDKPAFSAAQRALFPIYFGMQTILPAVLALTFPGNALAGVPCSISGLLNGSSRWSSLAPIATMFLGGLTNLAVLLPATVKVMDERRGQVKRDGREWYEEGPHSEEMRALNKRFGMLHGISSLVNLATLVAAIAYGFTLGARVQTISDRLA